MTPPVALKRNADSPFVGVSCLAQSLSVPLGLGPGVQPQSSLGVPWVIVLVIQAGEKH